MTAERWLQRSASLLQAELGRTAAGRQRQLEGLLRAAARPTPRRRRLHPGGWVLPLLLGLLAGFWPPAPTQHPGELAVGTTATRLEDPLAQALSLPPDDLELLIEADLEPLDQLDLHAWWLEHADGR